MQKEFFFFFVEPVTCLLLFFSSLDYIVQKKVLWAGIGFISYICYLASGVRAFLQVLLWLMNCFLPCWIVSTLHNNYC